MRFSCPGSWLLWGDFNLIYRDTDKNNNNLNHRMMGRFRLLLKDLGLKELYLHGRHCTWYNGQSPPTLVLLDRFFCTSVWEDAHYACHVRCLASVVSNHCPLLLDYAPLPPSHRRFCFEEFWLRTDGFHDTVTKSAWASMHGPDPFHRLTLRLQATTLPH